MADPIETNLGDVMRQIAAVLEKKPAGVLDAVRRAFLTDGARWEASMVSSISGPLVLEGRKDASAKLASRKGAAGLRGAFFYRVTGSTLSNLKLVKGNTSRYAVTHELGTVGAGGTLPDIVPKRARALTVPLKAAMTASGVPREPSARHWPDTFILPATRAANRDTFGWIVQDRGGGDLVFLYRLARRVSIPPRLGMLATHKGQEERRAGDILDALRRGIQTR